MSDLDELHELCMAANRSGDPSLAGPLRDLAERVAASHPEAGAAARGGAYLLAFKLGFDPFDLDRAINELGTVCRESPSAVSLGNLAAALLERSDLSGNTEDHLKAIELLEQVLSDPDLSPATKIVRRTTLLSATLDGIEREFLDAHPRDAVTTGEQLLAEAGSAGAAIDEIANVTASAYYLASNQEDLSDSELERMVDLARQAAGALPDDHLDAPARLANLATMHLQVHHLTGDAQHLTEAVTTTQLAYESLVDQHPSRPLLINNLLNVALAAYEADGRAELVHGLVDEAVKLADAFRIEHPLRPIALSNIGLFTRVAASVLDRPELLDISIAVQRDALTQTPGGGHRRAGREASLALALADRYRRDSDESDILEAIDLSENALARSRRGHRIDIISFETNLANMYHDRFTLTGDFADLDRASELHRRGIGKIPPRHPDRALLLNNAGGCLHTMFLRLGYPDDLRDSLTLLGESVDETPAHSPLLATRRINYASALDSAASHSTTPAPLLDAAKQQIRLALAADLHNNEREVAVGILVAVLRSRHTLLGEHDALDEMAAADPPDQPSPRPATSLRRGITAGLRGDRTTEEAQLRTALKQGRQRHPAVALTAASLLADHAIRTIAAGDAGAIAILDEAATVALDVRNHIDALDQTADIELSWYRDLDGVGDALAHGRLLGGDPQGAVHAIEATRGWFLGRNTPTSEAALGIPTIYMWTTEVGAGVVINDDARVEGRAIPDVNLADLRRHVAAIRSRSRTGEDPVNEVDDAVAYLTTHFGEPLSDLLGQHEQAAFSLAGPLASLPLSAIDTPSGLIAEGRTLYFGPTRSTLGWALGEAARRSLDVRSILSFADADSNVGPPLAAALSESKYIADEPARRHGAAATRSDFLRALNDVDVIHAALHASSSSHTPLLSRLFFADGPLHVDTILRNAPFTARLAILSACETSTRADIATDQLLALSNAIHSAGVPAVLGSLWSVGDFTGARFVAMFFDHLREGAAPAAALRDTQSALRRRGAPTSQWAAFELLGA